MGLIIGLGIVAVAVVGGVAWWTQRTPAPPAEPGAALVATPVPMAPVVVVPQNPQPAAGVQAAAAVPPAPVAYQPVQAPLPVMGPSTVVAQQSARRVATAPAQAPVPVPVPVAAAPARAAPPVASAAPAPESQRAGVPQVSFGGYMYSKNPADRLLLIDKTLRREGEEVAPGLVLERLLPRAAVMNYRGTRYRVPY